MDRLGIFLCHRRNWIINSLFLDTFKGIKSIIWFLRCIAPFPHVLPQFFFFFYPHFISKRTELVLKEPNYLFSLFYYITNFLTIYQFSYFNFNIFIQKKFCNWGVMNFSSCKWSFFLAQTLTSFRTQKKIYLIYI